MSYWLWPTVTAPARVWGGALLVALIAAALPAGAETRVWTDQDGRRYDAEIVNYFQDQVTFRRADGRTFTLALEDLVPPDQLLAREWSNAQPALAIPVPPPLQRLSPLGRQFVLDEPRVVRLRPLPGKGYPSPYLGVSLTRRAYADGRPAPPLEFVRVYFFDANRQPISYPLPPAGAPQMIQEGQTTAFVRPADFKVGETYIVLFPIKEPNVRTATYALVVAGNFQEVVATVYPTGSWRDFDFLDKAQILRDRYADYSAQELYTEKTPAELFDIAEVTRLRPRSGDATPERDYFRLSLRVLVPFPAAALSAQWFAFDKEHRLIYAETEAPYADAHRKDALRYLLLAGLGPAELNDPIPPTRGDTLHTLHLPGGTWWDKPEVDSLVFVFGTETKKTARVFSKSGATLADLPLPEKAAFAGATPAPAALLPERTY